LALFFACLASKFEKSTNITFKKMLKKSNKVSKNAEFHADLKSVEKVFYKCTKKVISKTSLTNMSKSGKVHISVTFLLITF
jgi:phosphoenolpyruvate carboxylase